jgi:hypothetical protein
MERDIPGLQVADHFPGTFDRDVITDREQNPAIPLKRLVDLRTLFTHCRRPISGLATCHLVLYDDCAGVLFQWDRFYRRGNVSGDEVVSAFRRSDADLLFRKDPKSVVNP